MPALLAAPPLGARCQRLASPHPRLYGPLWRHQPNGCMQGDLATCRAAWRGRAGSSSWSPSRASARQRGNTDRQRRWQLSPYGSTKPAVQSKLPKHLSSQTRPALKTTDVGRGQAASALWRQAGPPLPPDSPHGSSDSGAAAFDLCKTQQSPLTATRATTGSRSALRHHCAYAPAARRCPPPNPVLHRLWSKELKAHGALKVFTPLAPPFAAAATPCTRRRPR